MKLTKEELFEATLEWLLNVYDEVEEPIQALTEMTNEPVLAQQVFDAIQVECRSGRGKGLFGCEVGDVTARKFVKKQLALFLS